MGGVMEKETSWEALLQEYLLRIHHTLSSVLSTHVHYTVTVPTDRGNSGSLADT